MFSRRFDFNNSLFKEKVFDLEKAHERALCVGYSGHPFFLVFIVLQELNVWYLFCVESEFRVVCFKLGLKSANKLI